MTRNEMIGLGVLAVVGAAVGYGAYESNKGAASGTSAAVPSAGSGSSSPASSTTSPYGTNASATPTNCPSGTTPAYQSGYGWTCNESGTPTQQYLAALAAQTASNSSISTTGIDINGYNAQQDAIAAAQTLQKQYGGVWSIYSQNGAYNVYPAARVAYLQSVAGSQLGTLVATYGTTSTSSSSSASTSTTAQNTALQSQVTAAQQTLATLSQQKQTLTAQYTQLSAQLSTLRTDVQNLQTGLAQYQSRGY